LAKLVQHEEPPNIDSAKLNTDSAKPAPCAQRQSRRSCGNRKYGRTSSASPHDRANRVIGPGRRGSPNRSRSRSNSCSSSASLQDSGNQVVCPNRRCSCSRKHEDQSNVGLVKLVAALQHRGRRRSRSHSRSRSRSSSASLHDTASQVSCHSFCRQ